MRTPEGERWEMIDGVPHEMSPTPSIRHQHVVGEVFIQLGLHFRGKACKAFMAPLSVRLDDHNFVEPDIFVVCERKRLCKTHIAGPPDLVIEVLSPSGVHKDRFFKTGLYARHGVPEYWIVDTEAERVEVFALRDGAYVLAGAYEKKETVRSAKFRDLRVSLLEVFDFPDEKGGDLRVIKEPRVRYGVRARAR
jgi:Uma2 family endonuclease